MNGPSPRRPSIDIISVPPAIRRSSEPDMIELAAILTLVIPEPQKRSSVSPCSSRWWRHRCSAIAMLDDDFGLCAAISNDNNPMGGDMTGIRGALVACSFLVASTGLAAAAEPVNCPPYGFPVSFYAMRES